MQPQAKEHQVLLQATRIWKGGIEGVSLSLQEEPVEISLDFRHLDFQLWADTFPLFLL